jgi:hypothetical protein
MRIDTGDVVSNDGTTVEVDAGNGETLRAVVPSIGNHATVLTVEGQSVVLGGGSGGGDHRLPKVYYQDFRPGVDMVEGDYWVRPSASTVDVARPDVLTHVGKWHQPGLGYPQGQTFTAEAGGLRITYTTPTDNAYACTEAFGVDGKVYRVEVDVVPSRDMRLRLVWAFTRDGGEVAAPGGQTTTLSMMVPWHTGQNPLVGPQCHDAGAGGSLLVTGVRVIDVTDDRGEQYVFDDEHGWLLIGDGKGGGGGASVAYQPEPPATPAVGDVWVDSDVVVAPTPNQWVPLDGVMAAGWQPWAGGPTASHAPAYKIVSGVVFLRGLVRTDAAYTATAPILTLPEVARPDAGSTKIVVAMTEAPGQVKAAAEVRIDGTTGVLILQYTTFAVGGSWLSLSSISYPARG